jgi:hypothetical protein
VQTEFFKILNMPNPLHVVNSLQCYGLLELLSPQGVCTDRLQHFLSFERQTLCDEQMNGRADGQIEMRRCAVTRLAVLMKTQPFRLSRAQRRKFNALSSLMNGDDNISDIPDDTSKCTDLVFEKLWPIVNFHPEYWYDARLCLRLPFKVLPVFPLQGADLVKYGVTQGTVIGDTLRAVKQIWYARDFVMNHGECLSLALQYCKNIEFTDCK